MWIDSHCHLNHPNIAEHGVPDDIISAAQEQGVDGMLTICCRISEELDTLKSIAQRHDNVWYTIGTHPHDAGKPDEMAITQEQLVKMAGADQKIVGIGETGLDYHYMNSTKEDQETSFRKHMRACIETDLPMVVHAREADEDVARMMAEEGSGTKLKGVMHCFSSGRGLAEAALDMGFYISLSGIVTFNKAEELRAIARDVPMDRILVETDAPFLAPLPNRGKINHPAYVRYTGEFLAEMFNMDATEFAALTTRNFFNLFDKAKTS